MIMTVLSTYQGGTMKSLHILKIRLAFETRISKNDTPQRTSAMCGRQSLEGTVEKQLRRLGISNFNQSDKEVISGDIF